MGRVTVRAVWPMPGVERGAVVTVTLGPDLQRLIAAGRYELVDEPQRGDAAAASAADQATSTQPDPVENTRAERAATGRRGRGR